MNWEQYGRTFKSAFTVLYVSNTSGKTFPALLQDFSLNTGTSFSFPTFAAKKLGKSLEKCNLGENRDSIMLWNFNELTKRVFPFSFVRNCEYTNNGMSMFS